MSREIVVRRRSYQKLAMKESYSRASYIYAEGFKGFVGPFSQETRLFLAEEWVISSDLVHSLFPSSREVLND